MNLAIWKNYLTTAFGILAGLPVLVVQSCAAMGISLSPAWNHGLLIAGALGLIGLGVVSKAFNVSSTQEQVDKATVGAEKK